MPSNNMIKTVYFTSIILLLIGCSLSKPIARDISFENWTMDFIHSCGNTANHKPCIILVQVKSGHKASVKWTYYWFYEQTETVHKGETIGRGRKNRLVYSVVYSDSINIHFDKDDIQLQQNPKYKYGNLVSLSPLDSFVLNKVIELSDSEKIKNLSYLLKVKGFRQIIETSER
jgi:hypothetical protein